MAILANNHSQKSRTYDSAANVHGTVEVTLKGLQQLLLIIKKLIFRKDYIIETDKNAWEQRLCQFSCLK